MGLKASKVPKGPEINEYDRAVLTLKTQRRKLDDQQKLLGQRIETQVLAAKQLLQEQKKERALLMMKKKKMTENQMMQLHTLILSVENTLSTLEMQKQQAKVFAVLNESNEVLKVMQQQVRIEDVQRLMADTAEAKAYQQELDAALSTSLSDAERQAAEEELAQLEDAVLTEMRIEMPSAPMGTRLPEAEKQAAAAAAAGRMAARPQLQQEEEERERVMVPAS